jgi:hypothetical protein
MNNNNNRDKKIQETKKIREILEGTIRQVIQDQEISLLEELNLLSDLNDIRKKYQCRECEKVTDNEALFRIYKKGSKYNGHYHKECFKNMVETKEQEQLTKKAKEYQHSIIALSTFTLLFCGITCYF